MNSQKVWLLGTALATPGKAIGNDQIGEWTGKGEEWVIPKTGIQNRFYLSDGASLDDLGAVVAKKAIRNSSLRVDPRKMLFNLRGMVLKLFMTQFAWIDFYTASSHCLSSGSWKIK
ncbi:beta-ketoacyl-[acyl-carrier-protein] synthase family protein [Corynebacterium gerontici]|uniref:3-oxoacyl-(Acyl carrier protein) synthase III n=1 Tax=Corynebacterium gerontici TaxID=2079234 RepID=A0A3G6J0R3_9CORY|nr:hypothetical protein [Corynebacterium gerontici]AZA10548.1 3-oxoacyl-(acyl carrier protein) synthase III [Corynebacterium gerontici]